MIIYLMMADDDGRAPRGSFVLYVDGCDVGLRR
jgi:hypothetical protein